MKEELHKNQVAFQCRQALLARWVVPSVLSSSQEESHIALAAISTWKSQYIHLLKRPSNQSWATTTEKKAGGVPLLHTLHFPFPRTTPTNQLGIRKQPGSSVAFDSNFDYFLIFHGLISNLHRGSTGRSQLLLSLYLPFLNILGSLESLLASLLIPLNE